MKNKTITALTLCAAWLATGCAHMGVASKTQHRLTHSSIAVPPGWTVVEASLTNSATGNQITQFEVSGPGTNAGGFFANLTAPRPHVYRDFTETWTDTSKGGGTFVFTDPSASALNFSHTNQTALGGGRSTSVGQVQSVITTNAVQAIGAVGSAAGNVIGAAVKAASGTP